MHVSFKKIENLIGFFFKHFFIFQNAIKVPYFCRFHVYARSDWFARVSNNVENHKSTNEKTTTTAAAKKPAAANNPAHVRILCLTDPARAVNPLELQEDFTEIARSDVVEVRDKSDIDVQFGGNLFKSQRNNDEASDELFGMIFPDKTGRDVLFVNRLDVVKFPFDGACLIKFTVCP